MDIIVRVTRDIEINNECDFRDIETSGCNVGGNKDPGSLSTETSKIVDTLRLLEARMKGCYTVFEQSKHVFQ
jgi:hypothetical protein